MFEGPKDLTQVQWLLKELMELRNTIHYNKLQLQFIITKGKKLDRASSTRHQAQASNFPLTARSCAQNLFLPETICENINRALPARKVHLNLGWPIIKVWLTFITSPFRGQADSVWPKAPTINDDVRMNSLVWPTQAPPCEPRHT